MKSIDPVTTYTGEESPELFGKRVRIVGIFRSASAGQVHAATASTLLASVTALDRVQVVPWMEDEQRYDILVFDVLATDLQCFRHLLGRVQ